MAEKRQKNSMSREEARAMYDTLRKNLNGFLAQSDGKPGAKLTAAKAGAGTGDGVAATVAAIKSALRAEEAPRQSPVQSPMKSARKSTESRGRLNRGQRAAVLMVLLCAAFKLVLSAMEVSGIMTASPVEASLLPAAERQMAAQSMVAPQQSGNEAFGPEGMKILTTLDARRASLEERNRRLDERAKDLDRRDAEYVARLTELRDLTQRLKVDREKNDKKRDGQLDQLANVYGSMNPQEAASLIDQLDITIALPLLQRMPEKRMAQVLSMMAPERALSMTRVLSGLAK